MNNYLKNNFDPVTLVDVFDELPLWSAPFGLKLLEHVIYKNTISALDIGFGTGFPLTELAMRLGPGSKVYGIDPWKEAIQRAKKKIEFYGIKHVVIFEGSAESIPLEDNSLDLIVSNNGINNIANINGVYKECFRVLRSGGQFLQTMNTDGTMIEFYIILESILLELKLTDSIQTMKQHIYEKRKPVDEILNLLKQHGFNCKNLEEDKFKYTFSNGTAFLNHYFIRLAFIDSWIKLLPEIMVHEIFTELERRMNVHAENHGNFQLSIPFVLLNTFKN